MKLAEALSHCVEGARMTAAHMQDGSYVEHSFGRGMLRCWGFDPPQRTQCDFVAHADDIAAEDWHELVRVKPVRSVWGTPIDPTLPPQIDEGRRGKGEPGGVIGKLSKTDALASVGFVIPGATPVVDTDAPKRDGWGRPID